MYIDLIVQLLVDVPSIFVLSFFSFLFLFFFFFFFTRYIDTRQYFPYVRAVFVNFCITFHSCCTGIFLADVGFFFFFFFFKSFLFSIVMHVPNIPTALFYALFIFLLFFHVLCLIFSSLHPQIASVFALDYFPCFISFNILFSFLAFYSYIIYYNA